MKTFKKLNPKFGKEKKALITFFVKSENLQSSKDWAREMKIANKLWERYPDVNFWNSFKLTFNLKSLAWLIGEEGDAQIRKQWEMFQLDKSRELSIMYEENKAEPFTPPVQIKPKTLKDFLK